MARSLQIAIVNRLRGIEVMTGRFADAQAILATYLSQEPSDSLPAVRYGSKSSDVLPYQLTFHHDAGGESLAGSDIGIIDNTIYRFEIWDSGRGDEVIPLVNDALETLCDERKGAPVWTLEDTEDRIFYSELFLRLQGPFHDDFRNMFYGVTAFRWVEARP